MEWPREPGLKTAAARARDVRTRGDDEAREVRAHKKRAGETRPTGTERTTTATSEDQQPSTGK
eukprot:14671057-Alexandrium_andersonii.AAC.1